MPQKAKAARPTTARRQAVVLREPPVAPIKQTNDLTRDEESDARATRPARKKPAAVHANDAECTTYHVVLRTRKKAITAKVQDRVLYPMAVAWNRLLSTDQGRQTDAEAERDAWRQTGHKAIMDLARAGEVSSANATAFINAAAESGEVEVEMPWEKENQGWAARVFPWEALIALATKKLRGSRPIVVVRVLRLKKPKSLVQSGPACFAVSAGAKAAGYDVISERTAIKVALGEEKLQDLPADTLLQLAASVHRARPRLLHYVLTSAEGLDVDAGARRVGVNLNETARITASTGPQLIAYSTCHSGRRLAPLAVANGAGLCLGFHGTVLDSALPAFFGTFYRAWLASGNALEALAQGLAVNRAQTRPSDLGVVTLWSATSLMESFHALNLQAPASTLTDSDTSSLVPTIAAADVPGVLTFTCNVAKTLDYSMLHNQRGGLFSRFDVYKSQAGRISDLEVHVRIDSGLGIPPECHFFAQLPEETDRTLNFLDYVKIPLGSELLRRRGEMLRGTVEITIKYGSTQLFHRLDSIELPPCDEWTDDKEGRRVLPSFIFPRDPAIREILTVAQPFLRALADNQRAGFDGYQRAFTDNPTVAVRVQLLAIWAALQQVERIDYASPPPTYTRRVQRLRVPEEILRARRATCIELALLLASCWEHIGIYPVIFLTPGHAFLGYWESDKKWKRFIDTRNLIDQTRDLEQPKTEVERKVLTAGMPASPAKRLGGGTSGGDEPWVFFAPHHLVMIKREVTEKNLIPVEATFLAVQNSFGTAEAKGREIVQNIQDFRNFDVMIDVQTARVHGITPLAIVTQATVA